MVLVFRTRGMKADFMREYYDFWPLDNSKWRIKVGWQSDSWRNFQTILTNLRIIINSSACFLFVQMSTIIIQIHTQCINNRIRCYHRILIAVLLLIRSGIDAWEYKYLHIHKTMINIYDHVIRFYLLAIIISYNKYWFQRDSRGRDRWRAPSRDSKRKKYIERICSKVSNIWENLGELEFLVLESIGYSNALAINFIEDVDENRDRDSTEHGLRRYYTRYTI